MNSCHLVEIRHKKYESDRHPRIIIGSVGNNYIAFVLTHEKYKGKKHDNYKLDSDPLGSTNDCYVRRNPEIRRKSTYTDLSIEGKLSNKDYEYLKTISDRKKEKYEKRNQQSRTPSR